ncbi:MAG TPA: multicopper oxidase domain-containing protein [Acetobacteraceae bacterium]|nr:multicopper oxidase domain-containing protein [Acetobacteraceae bacterium]
MATLLPRRGLLLGTASIVATGALPATIRTAAAQTPIRLNTVTRVLEVNGKAATVLGVLQDSGLSGLYLDPGERFLVDLNNRLAEDTIVHWHGQTPPVAQDGVAITGEEKVIPPGTSASYDFAPRPGTYWMHSHQGLQELQLLSGPLIVRTAADLKEDAQEVTVILHDFTFKTPEEVMKDVNGGAMAGMGASSVAGAQPAPMAAPMAGMSGGQMSGMAMGGPASGKPAIGAVGSMPGMAMPATGGGKAVPMKPGMQMGGDAPDVNDFDYDAYLANDRTLSDPFVVRTERNGRVHLRLINGASSTIFWLELDGVDGTLIAVDGEKVRPLRGRRFPLAEAQRIDLMIDVPAGKVVSVLAQREGDRVRTGFILAAPGAQVRKIAPIGAKTSEPMATQLEARLAALTPLAARRVDRRLPVMLGGTMSPYGWTINGRAWADREPLHVKKGERVVFDIVNQTPMGHPMHLHGHVFQVVELNGKAFSGAMRDTVQVPAKGSVKVAFDADNPGRWVFHCHNLLHMESGMITEVVYDS